MTRPFPFETPVAGDALIDRRDELHQLHLAATDGAHVRLAVRDAMARPRCYSPTLATWRERLAHGPRRLLRRHHARRGVRSDRHRLLTLGDPHVRSHLEALSSRLGVDLEHVGGGSHPRSSPAAARAGRHGARPAAELLDLPLRLHRRDRRPTLVVFDEFQDLLSAGATLDGLLRSHVQYHGDAATYIYAGSQPSMMRRLFTDRERPLYGQAEPLELAPLPMDEVLVELADRSAELGEDPGEALAPLMVAASGHPQRTMLLAHLLHRELGMREAGGTTLPECRSGGPGSRRRHRRPGGAADERGPRRDLGLSQLGQEGGARGHGRRHPADRLTSHRAGRAQSGHPAVGSAGAGP